MKALISIIFLALIALAVKASVFVIRVDETAVRVRLGQIVQSDYTPGLHFKVPLVEDIYIFDKRVQTIDTPPQRVLTVEKKNVMVDLFVKWRIVDTKEFYVTTGGRMEQAASLLEPVVRKSLLDSFGQRTVDQVVAQDRSALLDEIEANAAARAGTLGLELVDVRVKRVEWPEDVLPSVYNRMKTERATVAQKFRSEGDEEARRVRADSERQRDEILAKAEADALSLRGEGDALAAKIYADAYSVDPEFYSFYRSTKAYTQVFGGQGDMMVIDSDSDFFRYLKSSSADTN